MAKYKITFIGSGNVATTLARAFDQVGHTINQVISRKKENAGELAKKFGAYYSDQIPTMYKDSDFIIISVADELYQEVVTQIPKGMNAIICHTAGAVPMQVLENTGMDCGVLYPLQSFRKEKLKSVLEVPFFIEYGNKSVKYRLGELADSISNKVVEASSQEREKYHLAAVFANNFTNLMYSLADKYLSEEGLNFQYLLPIIKETADRLKYDKPANWQTGPANRGDKAVIEKHLGLIKDEKTRELYKTLSEFLMTKQ